VKETPRALNRVDLFEESTPIREAGECIVCLEKTAWRKPYCINHLDRSDYISGLMSRMDLMAAEKLGHTKPELFLEEVLSVLQENGKAMTLLSLAKMCHASVTITTRAVGALVRKKKVYRSRTSRQLEMVVLVE